MRWRQRTGDRAASTRAAGTGGEDGGWQAPSEVEQRLYEAKLRGDWDAYLEVLARTDLHHEASRAYLDSHPGQVRFRHHRRPKSRTWYVPLLTPGMLPSPEEEARHPGSPGNPGSQGNRGSDRYERYEGNNPFDEDAVFYVKTLGWFARAWKKDDPRWLVVNPGSPCEARFSASPGRRRTWTQVEDRLPADHWRFQLLSLWRGGARDRTVVHGLACGAALCVTNGAYWNALSRHGASGYLRERERLEEWWDITSRADWEDTVARLLRAEVSRPGWHFVLDARASLARAKGGPVDIADWRQAVEDALRAHAAPAVELTPDGVTTTEPPSESAIRSQLAALHRLIGSITRYESRFRADGLLAERQFISSVTAWDYGRAANVVRWGLGARHCTREEAETAIRRVSKLSRVDFRSWEEFSASYVLGRCLHFDKEEFGDWYQEGLKAHRILTTDPTSPWLTIRFR